MKNKAELHDIIRCAKALRAVGPPAGHHALAGGPT
jgi:hypothetical protein